MRLVKRPGPEGADEEGPPDEAARDPAQSPALTQPIQGAIHDLDENAAAHSQKLWMT